MPELKKAELIEGVVYMGSPVSLRPGRPHLVLACWLGFYEAVMPGIAATDNTTVRLDNEPQPDLLLGQADGQRADENFSWARPYGMKNGAGDAIRTHDHHVGNVMLYH